MSKNVVTPRSVSFKDALRNLASRLTGRTAAELPRTQEGVVQFLAENVPSPDEMAKSITQEVLARLGSTSPAPDEDGGQENPDKAAQEAHDASGASGGTSTPGEAENLNTEAPVADGKPRRGSKPKTQK